MGWLRTVHKALMTILLLSFKESLSGSQAVR